MIWVALSYSLNVAQGLANVKGIPKVLKGFLMLHCASTLAQFYILTNEWEDYAC